MKKIKIVLIFTLFFSYAKSQERIQNIIIPEKFDFFKEVNQQVDGNETGVDGEKMADELADKITVEQGHGDYLRVGQRQRGQISLDSRQ
jgi:hypothetical protein